MMRKFFYLTATAAIALAVACGDRSPNPASPTETPAPIVDPEAAADGTTLKVTAPTPASPANGVELAETKVPPLIVNDATGKYTTPTGLLYRFQFFDASDNLIEQADVVAGAGAAGAGRTEWTPTAKLDNDKTYRWRARAQNATGAFGPWSATWSFKTPKLPEAYLKANEVFDPLTNGRTVGEIHGPVQFIPGKGVKLLDFTSRITYRFTQTLEAGEFSLMATEFDEGSDGDKSKVMSMQEGDGDITTNDYRFTVEKRGRRYPTPGAVTFRIIVGGGHDTIHDGRRYVVPFADELWYFWKAKWGGVASVEVIEGGSNGRVLYSESVGQARAYRPVPHVVHLGAPVGRACSCDATVPGIVIANVWVGEGKRPEFPPSQAPF